MYSEYCFTVDSVHPPLNDNFYPTFLPPLSIRVYGGGGCRKRKSRESKLRPRMLIWYILHCVVNVLPRSTTSLPLPHTSLPHPHTSLFYHDESGVIKVWWWVEMQSKQSDLLLKVFVVHEAYGYADIM